MAIKFANLVFQIIYLNIIVCSMPLFAATYYVSQSGKNNNSGTSPGHAWQTIGKVNTMIFSPGDSVLFKRGDCWREQIIPQSGSPEGYIVYGAYGIGDKPLLLGSIQKNSLDDWIQESNNIWTTTEPKSIGDELLLNSSFENNSDGWGLWFEGGANVSGSRDVTDYDSPPASYRIDCLSNGSAANHIQFYTSKEMSITFGKIYKLKFRAKSTRSFRIPGISLMKMTYPWNSYYSHAYGSPTITNEWATYTVYYKANATVSDARLTFFLGGVLPEGGAFFIDTISFKECEIGFLYCDVGNIIFNEEQSCGVKVWYEVNLNTQGDFWYDQDNALLKIYSVNHPASFYFDIECALTAHIIDESNKGYVIYETIALKYGAAHGIGGGNTNHIIVRECDLSFIGGGKLKIEGYNNIRYGNGIEFWGNAHDNLVESCRLWEIYDAALTNQNNAENVKQYNIFYRNNVIWNCEYSFEYWNRPASSSTDGIYFVNNTCVNAGGGWGHSQRPDPAGRHLCFYSNTANTSNMQISNNIFYEATENCFYLFAIFNGLENLKLNYNCWYQANGDFIMYGYKKYTLSQFSTYQFETGQDENSIIENPLFYDIKSNDFFLTENSPCINAGDPNSPLDPDNSRADIGAYYFDLSQVGVKKGSIHKPTAYFLYQNYPNPFNPATTIPYTIPFSENLTIKVFNVLGKEIEKLVSGYQLAGDYTIQWQAENLPGGIYFYRLWLGTKIVSTKKMLLLK